MAVDVEERRFGLRERDGIELAAQQWSVPGIAPRVVLVVSHGMGEHSGRYLAPLAPLIRTGAIVYVLDHRGHGASVPAGSAPGDFGPGGFAGVVGDLVALIEQARSEQPALPVILLGHSMGSMIAQALVLDHADLIDGLVLSGSAAVDVLAMAGAANPEVFGALNMPFEPARTPFDWLSRDEAEVDRYLADPLCGFPLQPVSFLELFSQGQALAEPDRIAAIGPRLPIWIASGDKDPLCGMLGALQPLIDRYRVAGLDVEVILYPDARHEILNETNRSEVVRDLAAFIKRAAP